MSIQKEVVVKSLSIRFPHLGNNFLSFYILIRLFQWISLFLMPIPNENFLGIPLLNFEIFLHVGSICVGLLLLFRVKKSLLVVQLFQVVLIAQGLFVAMKFSEWILVLLLHGIWIGYFALSPRVKEVYTEK